MTFRVEKPTLDPKNPEKSIALLDTWLANLTDQLNYHLNHLNAENLATDLKEGIKNGSIEN
jgi:hypothetical protein